MADQKFTRCPGCATVFRVTPAQLALRDGQVRCGHCRAVFDANDHFVTLDIVAPEEFGADDELLPVSAGDATPPMPAADAMPGPVADAMLPVPGADATSPVPATDATSP